MAATLFSSAAAREVQPRLLGDFLKSDFAFQGHLASFGAIQLSDHLISAQPTALVIMDGFLFLFDLQSFCKGTTTAGGR